MPLKALLDGEPILAPLLGDTAWAELYFQRHRLVLPCCPGVAVQMRGGAGTTRIQHFSHAPSPTCAFRGETTAHLRAKVEIARACAEAGWAVDIEHAEDEWRADVLAARRGVRVAFEVQWSRQALAAIEARQARYRAAGVRGCWFVRYPPPDPRRPTDGADIVARRDLPLFPLERGRERDTYRVRVEGHAYPLGRVVGALLDRHLAFRAQRTLRGAHPLTLTYYDKACPSCGAPVCLYRLAPGEAGGPYAGCGARVLLWSEAPYHPDVARAARVAYAQEMRRDGPPLALVAPGAGFRCPRCRGRVAPAPASGPTEGATPLRVPVTVTFARPLRDPHPHWCYPAGGAFCDAAQPYSGDV